MVFSILTTWGNGSAIAYSDAVLYAGNRLSTKGPANVIVNKLNEQTIISWKPINESNIKGYRIYRITGDTSYKFIGRSYCNKQSVYFTKYQT
jgi:hypothetical protein